MDTLVSNLNDRALKSTQAFKAWKDAPDHRASGRGGHRPQGRRAEGRRKVRKAKRRRRKKTPPPAPPPEFDPKPHRIHEVVGSRVSHVILYEYNAVPDPSREVSC